MLEHPLAVTAGIGVAALLIGWLALDAERLAAQWRARRRRDGRGGWIGGAR